MNGSIFTPGSNQSPPHRFVRTLVILYNMIYLFNSLAPKATYYFKKTVKSLTETKFLR